MKYVMLEKGVKLQRLPEIKCNEGRYKKILHKIFGEAFRIFLLASILLSIFVQVCQAQSSKIVKGIVTDSNNEPLHGVSVKIKGSSLGTSTAEDGRFMLNVPESNDILEFSYVGFTTQEIKINGRNEIVVTMSPDAKALSDVVIVGYGSEKKINLTGAVSTVNKDLLEKREVTQTSQLLEGAASGVTVTQPSGQPGSDQAGITIRGLGTFSGAGNNPLVLVDGVESSINSVSPNDIASVSVLKDAASASIYGSRAANGVILITTKVGTEGKVNISYNAYVGKQEATQMPQYVNSWTYAQLSNEAQHNMGLGDIYTADEIAKFKSGVDPDNYPNKSHVKDLFTSGTGFQTKHNISVNGSKAGTKYLFSLGYLNQNGIVKKTSYDRYDYRLNLDTKIRSNLSLSVKLSGNYSNQNAPAMMTTENAPGGFDAILRAATEANATEAGAKSDGTYGTHMGHATASAGLNSPSFQDNKNTYSMNNFSFEWKIIPELKFTTRFAYDINYQKGDDYCSIFSWDNQTVVQGPSKLQVNTSNNKNLTLDSYFDYDKTFSDRHFIHLLAGFSHIKNDYESLAAYRENSPSTQLYVLNAFGSTNQTNAGTASETKLNSVFGRINYRFEDKYLLEGNVRYDGSSRFSQKTRYGLFPSVSAAWIVSKEDFFKVSWINSLKVRSSYGTLGNQEIGNYPYQKTLNLSQSYPLGEVEQMSPGIALTTLPFQNITWETVTSLDQGIDLDMFQNKLMLTVDHYTRRTSNILQSMTVSSVLGMNVSAQNAGKVENQGWDFELTYRGKINSFTFNIQPNFSINNNKVVSLGGVTKDIARGLFVGKPIGAIYGYTTNGLFVNQEDINNSATQNYNAVPGMIKYVDINGPSGKPDGMISADYDRSVIGYSNPKYSYGASVQAGWKGFDFFIQFQGLGGYQREISGIQLALFNNGNIQQWQADSHWSADNPDPNAKYPVLIPLSSTPESPFGDVSTYWLRNASFLRLKTFQLGYTFSDKIIKGSFLSNLRIYVGGQNLFTFDNYYPGWDPEMGTGGYANSSYYPPTRLWTAGVNVNF